MIFAGLTKSIFTIETDRLTATPAYDLINTLPQIPDGQILALEKGLFQVGTGNLDYPDQTFMCLSMKYWPNRALEYPLPNQARRRCWCQNRRLD